MGRVLVERLAVSRVVAAVQAAVEEKGVHRCHLAINESPIHSPTPSSVSAAHGLRLRGDGLPGGGEHLRRHESAAGAELRQGSERGGGGEHGLALDERRDEPVLHHAQLEQLGRQPRRLEEGSEKARGRV